jgi:hypothetical protein
MAINDAQAAGPGELGGVGTDRPRTELLMCSGIAGRARIDRVTDTGTAINDNPQVLFDLTVTVPGHVPYAAALTQIVSRLSLGDFLPGATVPVRVSPDDPQTLMIA